MHTSLAAAANVPEMQLSQPEAQKLAASIHAVQEQYPATRIDPKIACLVQLAATVGVIYGTRVIAFKFRKNAERASRMPPPAAPQPMPQQPNAAQPAPAADTTFNPGLHMAPFGEQGAAPIGRLDYPITGG